MRAPLLTDGLRRLGYFLRRDAFRFAVFNLIEFGADEGAGPASATKLLTNDRING